MYILETIVKKAVGIGYYRAQNEFIGDKFKFVPSGYYEAIDEYGDPDIEIDNEYAESDSLELCASKTIGGAVMGAYSMSRDKNEFHIYQINDNPDVDISHWSNQDFTYLQEVRYRKEVEGKYIGKVILTEQQKKIFDDFYSFQGEDYIDSKEYRDIDFDKLVHDTVKTIRIIGLKKKARVCRQDDSTDTFRRLIQRGYDKGIWTLHENHPERDMCDALDGQVIDLNSLVSDLKYNAPIFEFSHVQCMCRIICYSTTNPDLDHITVDWKGESEEGRILDRKDRYERSKDFYRFYDTYREKYETLLNNRYLTGERSEPENGIYSFDITLYDDYHYNQNIKNQLQDKALDIILEEAKKYQINIEDAEVIGTNYIVDIEHALSIYDYSTKDLMEMFWTLEERRTELNTVMFELDNIRDWCMDTQDRINKMVMEYETNVQPEITEVEQPKPEEYKKQTIPEVEQQLPEGTYKSFDDLQKYYNEPEPDWEELPGEEQQAAEPIQTAEPEAQKTQTFKSFDDLKQYWDGLGYEDKPKQTFKDFNDFSDWWNRTRKSMIRKGMKVNEMLQYLNMVLCEKENNDDFHTWYNRNIKPMADEKIERMVNSIVWRVDIKGRPFERSCKEVRESCQLQLTDEKFEEIKQQAKERIQESEELRKKQNETLNTLNPTGGLFVDYNPEQRAKMLLGENITTLDKTMNKSPDELITIYRGAPKEQKEIVNGDFVTTNKELAQSYTWDGGVVLEKKVKLSDILDDITDPLAEEYIYRQSKKVPITQNEQSTLEALQTYIGGEIVKSKNTNSLYLRGKGWQVRLSDHFNKYPQYNHKSKNGIWFFYINSRKGLNEQLDKIYEILDTLQKEKIFTEQFAKKVRSSLEKKLGERDFSYTEEEEWMVGDGWWIDNDGKIIKLQDETHKQWANNHSESFQSLLEKGWIRISNENEGELDFQCNYTGINIGRMEKFINNFLLEEEKECDYFVIQFTGGGNYFMFDYDDFIENNMNLQKTINRQKRFGSNLLFNSKISNLDNMQDLKVEIYQTEYSPDDFGYIVTILINNKPYKYKFPERIYWINLLRRNTYKEKIRNKGRFLSEIKMFQIYPEKKVAGKQVGTLYHFTSVDSAVAILNEDTLKISSFYGTVSFTRNKNYNGSVGRYEWQNEVILVIDGDKLSNNYKITPYNFFKNHRYWKAPTKENEEIVKEDIAGISQYITGIIINKKPLNFEQEELEILCNQKGIPISNKNELKQVAQKETIESVINIPDVFQESDYSCGVKCVQTILAYYGEDNYETDLEDELKVDINGTPTKEIIQLFKNRGLQTKDGEFTIEQIKQYIDKKIPVILLIQAWSEDYNKNYINDSAGHYVVAIGYTENSIIFEDPAIFGRGYLTFEELEQRWHGEDNFRLDNYGIAVWGKKPFDFEQEIQHISKTFKIYAKTKKK